jgi:hypothetical protein
VVWQIEIPFEQSIAITDGIEPPFCDGTLRRNLQDQFCLMCVSLVKPFIECQLSVTMMERDAP